MKITYKQIICSPFAWFKAESAASQSVWLNKSLFGLKELNVSPSLKQSSVSPACVQNPKWYCSYMHSVSVLTNSSSMWAWIFSALLSAKRLNSPKSSLRPRIRSKCFLISLPLCHSLRSLLIFLMEASHAGGHLCLSAPHTFGKPEWPWNNSFVGTFLWVTPCVILHSCRAGADCLITDGDLASP